MNPQGGLKKVNLLEGREEGMRFISTKLEPEFEMALLDLLKEYQDVFAWSYEEMSRLSSELITHKLVANPSFKLVKQIIRNFSDEIQL